MAKEAFLSHILNILSVAVGIFIIYAIYQYATIHRKPTINTIHVINLDRDTKRWESVTAQANQLNLTIERFPAIYGKDIKYNQMRNLGVGNAMVRADRNDHKGERLNNLGIVGCYLSHRELLRQLGNMNVPDSYGHLVLEDDIRLPGDFLQPNGRWEQCSRHIPNDWDIVWLGIWKPYGEDVAPGVMKLKSDTRIRVNLGTFAYVVRHGSIKHKILPWFEHMIDAWDEQMNLKFNEWNCYALVPKIIEINDELQTDSAINKINVAPEENTPKK